jgi:hypothetical protein
MGQDCNPGVAVGMADTQLYNQKLLQDVSALALMSSIFQGVIDNQADARQRRTNAASADFLRLMASIDAAQTGTTEQQQPISPIRTGAADTQVQQPAGSVYPPNRNVDQGAATANVGIFAAMQAIADAMAEVQSKVGEFLAAAQQPKSAPGA